MYRRYRWTPSNHQQEKEIKDDKNDNNSLLELSYKKFKPQNNFISDPVFTYNTTWNTKPWFLFQQFSHCWTWDTIISFTSMILTLLVLKSLILRSKKTSRRSWSNFHHKFLYHNPTLETSHSTNILTSKTINPRRSRQILAGDTYTIYKDPEFFYEEHGAPMSLSTDLRVQGSSAWLAGRRCRESHLSRDEGDWNG